MMESHELPTICPFCDQHHEVATSTTPGDPDHPDDDDATICWRCGRVCIFDSEARGGLRKPTKKEQRDLERDRSVQDALAAWRSVKGN